MKNIEVEMLENELEFKLEAKEHSKSIKNEQIIRILSERILIVGDLLENN